VPLGCPLVFAEDGCRVSSGSPDLLDKNLKRFHLFEIQKFLSHDPLGYIDLYNLYGFASYDPINGWDPYGTNTRDFDWNKFWDGMKNIKAEDLNPAKETMVATYDMFGDQDHKDRVHTKQMLRKFPGVMPGSTYRCGFGCNISMGARVGLSIFDLVGAAGAAEGALKAGVKGSSRGKLNNAVKESVEESVDAAGKGGKKASGTPGNGGAGTGNGSGNGGAGTGNGSGNGGAGSGGVGKDAIPDDAIVCRGGSCTADRFRNGSGVGIDSSGNLQNVSVNSRGGKSLEELTVKIPHNKVGVTTVGDVRKAGGNVIPDPNKGNPFHAILEGITPEQAEKLMTPTVKNPNAK